MDRLMVDKPEYYKLEMGFSLPFLQLDYVNNDENLEAGAGADVGRNRLRGGATCPSDCSGLLLLLTSRDSDFCWSCNFCCKIFWKAGRPCLGLKRRGRGVETGSSASAVSFFSSFGIWDAFSLEVSTSLSKSLASILASSNSSPIEISFWERQTLEARRRQHNVAKSLCWKKEETKLNFEQNYIKNKIKFRTKLYLIKNQLFADGKCKKPVNFSLKSNFNNFSSKL